MNIHVLDDYQDTIRTLGAFAKVAGHQVTTWRDHTTDVGVLAERLRDAEAICLLRERTPVRRPHRAPRPAPHHQPGWRLSSHRRGGLARRTWATFERDALEEMFSAIFEQVVAYRAGAPINVVNPAALTAAARR